MATPATPAPASKDSTVRVRVPQEDGDITITLRPGTDEVRRFSVANHIVEATPADADLLRVNVEGSSLEK